MARQIDERIVQMTFNNQQFEKNANQTISTLDRLKQSLNFSKSIDGFKDIENASRGLDFSGLSIATSKISDGFSVMEQIAIGALRRIGEQAIDTGVRLIKSMTIDNISSGWNKYDQIIAAQQKIMSSVSGKANPITGEIYDLDAVLERIGKLKWYSDETSYSVDQMANAIGNFTSSGVDLDVATRAIMGISNASGDAGISAIQAESAFIGFAKAIGAGQMSQSVWNNQLKTSGLTNSERFKQSLLDAAEAAGTLIRIEDKLYTTDRKFTVGVDNLTENMTKYGWATTEVMLSALDSYSNTVDAIYSLTNGGKIDMSASVFDSLKKAMEEQGKTLEDLHLDKEYDQASSAIRALREAYEELGLEVPKSIDALARAQEAISFSQVLEATRVGVQSQFASIYENIFGNYEEAKKLWTGMSEDLYDWFITPLSTINDLVIDYKNLWQGMDSDYQMETFGAILDEEKEDLTQIQALWNDISSVITALGEVLSSVWSEVFDSPTAVQLYLFIEKIRNGLKNIFNFVSQESGKTGMYDINRGLEGILNTIKAISKIAKTFVNYFIKPLKDLLKPILLDILEIFGNIGDLFSINSKKLIEDMSPVQNIFIGLIDILKPFINIIEKVIKGIKEFTNARRADSLEEDAEHVSIFAKALQFVANIFTTIKNVVTNIGSFISPIIDKMSELIGKAKEFLLNPIGESNINPLGLAGLLWGFQKIFNFKWNVFDVATQALGIIKNGIESVAEVLSSFSGIMDASAFAQYSEGFRKVAITIAIFAGALFIISSIDAKELNKSIAVLALVYGAVIGLMEVFDKFGAKKMSKVATVATIASAIIGIGIAITELAIALKIISTINPEQMKTTLLGLSTVLLGISSFLFITNKLTKGMRDTKLATLAVFMKSIGKAMLELSVSLKIISTINANQMNTVLAGLVGTLGSISIFIALTNALTGGMRVEKIATLGAFMKSIGISMIELSLAMKILSTIDINNMGVAILGIISTLGAISLFIAATNKMTTGMRDTKLATLSSFMKGVGFALIEMSAALKILSTINIGNMGVALLGLVGVLSAIGLFAAAMNSFSGGAASFAGISAAMLILSVAIIALSGALVILSTLSWEGIAKGLVALGGALLIIGGLGAILGVASPFFLLFSVALLTFGAALGTVAVGLLKAIVAFTAFEALGVNFAKTLLTLFMQLEQAILAFSTIMLLAIINAALSVIDEIKNLIVRILDVIISTINELLPKIVELGFAVLKALMKGISDNIYEIATISMDIITEFLKAMTEKLPTLIDELLKFLISAINGVADGIRNNAQGFGEAIGNLISALITGITQGISGLAEGLGKGLWDGITSLFSGKEAEKENTNSGEKIIDDVKTGMTQSEPELLEQVDNIGTNITDKMDRHDDAMGSGQNTLKGVLAGVTDPSILSEIYNAGANAYNIWQSGFDDAGSIASPSKEMIKRGKFVILGLIKGLEETNNLEKVGYSTGEKVMNAISSAMEIANSILDNDLNPVITPVLDLSNVEENAGSISDLLGTNLSFAEAQNISKYMSSINNGGNQNSSIKKSNGEESNLTFVQNNYSPKALSAIDIYRQTKNQMSMVKGLVNSR